MTLGEGLLCHTGVLCAQAGLKLDDAVIPCVYSFLNELHHIHKRVLTVTCLFAAEADQFPQEKIFLTDEMLHPPPPTVHLFEDETEKLLGAHAHSAYNSATENTPTPANIRTPIGPDSGDPLVSLHDIYAEQNARLQGWALRSQTCLPIKLEDKLDASFAAADLFNDNQSEPIFALLACRSPLMQVATLFNTPHFCCVYSDHPSDGTPLYTLDFAKVCCMYD